MPDLTFFIPWENLCPDNRKFLSGKFILSEQYRNAKETVAFLAKASARKFRWKRASGPLGLDVALTEPDHRKRDVLNHAKMLCDAVTASEAVWWDDSQIAVAHFRRDGTDKANAGATVRIWILEG